MIERLILALFPVFLDWVKAAADDDDEAEKKLWLRAKNEAKAVAAKERLRAQSKD